MGYYDQAGSNLGSQIGKVLDVPAGLHLASSAFGKEKGPTDEEKFGDLLNEDKDLGESLINQEMEYKESSRKLQTEEDALKKEQTDMNNYSGQYGNNEFYKKYGMTYREAMQSVDSRQEMLNSQRSLLDERKRLLSAKASDKYENLGDRASKLKKAGQAKEFVDYAKGQSKLYKDKAKEND